jgi:hypothetical protein
VRPRIGGSTHRRYRSAFAIGEKLFDYAANFTAMDRPDHSMYRPRPKREILLVSLIPSFQTTSNSPLKLLHFDTVSANRSMSGVNLCCGIVGMSS